MLWYGRKVESFHAVNENGSIQTTYINKISVCVVSLFVVSFLFAHFATFKRKQIFLTLDVVAFTGWQSGHTKWECTLEAALFFSKGV